MRQYIVDAFTEKVFSGNPAGVVIRDAWLPDELMRDIARENNLSETAFAVKTDGAYALRWFTPGGEVDFCGHATLGASSVIFRFYEPEAREIVYRTEVGELRVTREGELFVMDFPAYSPEPVPVTDEMAAALGVRPKEAYMARDLLMVLGAEEEVRSLSPDIARLAALPGVCAAVTARGSGEYDCVSRVFVPDLGIPEDPVTGSTHCMIVPYWAEKLGKSRLTAYQASDRGGVLYTELCGGRVRIAGKAALYAVSEILTDCGL